MKIFCQKNCKFVVFFVLLHDFLKKKHAFYAQFTAI